MEKLKTYLIGSIQDDDKANEWRDKLTADLEALHFEVQDPCKAECNKTLADNIDDQKKMLRKLKRVGQWKRFHEVMSNIRQSDLTCVNCSAFVIVLYDVTKKIGGTVHEVVEALTKGIPIYTVLAGGTKTDANDWILDLLITAESHKFGSFTDKIFDNFNQMKNCIALDYEKYIKDYDNFVSKQRELEVTKQYIPEKQVHEKTTK